MTEPVESIERALARQDDFERLKNGYRVRSTPFAVLVRLEDCGDDVIRYVVEARLPTLDAVVKDETISDTLLEGWAEPLERRLTDVDGAWSGIGDVEVGCDWNRATFTATFRFEGSADSPPPIEDIRALVAFVEGSYLEGVIPGYEYDSPVSELLERARGR